MDKKVLTFGDIAIEKNDFYCQKPYFFGRCRY